MEVGLAGLTSNKKLPLIRGEKLFVNRTYCVRDVIPALLMGKSFVYSEIESAEATVESDGYVVAITPSNFVDIQRSLRKAGFDTVIERAEPIGFHPVGATLMTETVTYYAKYCNNLDITVHCDRSGNRFDGTAYTDDEHRNTKAVTDGGDGFFGNTATQE